jgi:hypothetical protein
VLSEKRAAPISPLPFIYGLEKQTPGSMNFNEGAELSSTFCLFNGNEKSRFFVQTSREKSA